jgi:hypothetical protein
MLTPVDRGKVRPSGASLWRKQLLPIGKISYKGRMIDFTREYLAGLAKSFSERAYDRVPFMIADKDNAHTEDPERRRGWVNGLELTDDGLDIIVAANSAGDALLADGPELGISAKIVEDYERADKRFFPAAIKHVLGTLDPRITGMRPWQAIEAAGGDGGEVIDLTALEFAAAAPDVAADPASGRSRPSPADPGTSDTEDTHMALNEAQEARLAKLLDLPEERFDALLADPAPADDEDGTEGDAPELTDAELEALLAEVGAEGDSGTEPDADRELAAAGAALSAEAQTQIDLANARAEQNEIALARVTSRLATAAYEAERDTLARVHGIPPRITDLARTLLEGEGRVVELANGKRADAGAIVRRVLTEIGKTVRMLDLSAELGSAEGADDDTAKAETEAAERRELVSAVRNMAGI